MPRARPLAVRRPLALASLCILALPCLILVPSCRRKPAPSELNLVFVLVDTMRADALPAAGRASFLSRLARDGTVFERAYAQASWTLPSISSMLAGRWPSESPGWSDGTQGVPRGTPPLAELLKSAGLRTAGFATNPLLKPEGFGRGFDSYWLSPVADSVFTPAAVPVDRAREWLAAHQRERFFVLLHLMDPHDPYCPPPRRSGPPVSWPGQPDPAFLGDAPMPDAATLASWKKLYAEEVAYMDGQLERLFASLDPAVRDRTAIVLTADHGEEFLDHGFLKHAVTLFDEAVHVPLVVFVPGERGRRIASIVRLVDVVPTVTDLLGVAVPAPVRSRWSGVSLAGAVRGTAEIPALQAMGETFGFGPLRWYVFDGRRKVVLFNREHRIPSELPALKNPNAWLVSHLPAEGVYASTLESPRDVAVTAGAEDDLRRARDLAARYVAGKIGGLWITVRGAGKGGRTRARLALAGARAAHVVPFFWRPGDRIQAAGDALELDVADDGVARAAVVVGADPAAAAAARWVPEERSERPDLPLRLGRPSPGETGAFAWVEPEERPPASAEAARTETLFRLRALGYIQ